MNIQESLNQVPDSVKVTVATSSAVFSIMGFSLQDWVYILSGVVSIMFIIEKLFSWTIRYKRYRTLKNESCE